MQRIFFLLKKNVRNVFCDSFRYNGKQGDFLGLLFSTMDLSLIENVEKNSISGTFSLKNQSQNLSTVTKVICLISLILFRKKNRVLKFLEYQQNFVFRVLLQAKKTEKLSDLK